MLLPRTSANEPLGVEISSEPSAGSSAMATASRHAPAPTVTADTGRASPEGVARPLPRRAAQDAFVNEQVDIVVATVAFGMGIDRSNVRYVVHAGMPKSLEHYQQEAGRAGRDGLEAECLLLHSGADHALWRSVLMADGAEPPPGALRKLDEMYAFCQTPVCRHRALVTYFGQPWEAASCRACAARLGETVTGEDTLSVAASILAGVDALRGRFGATHVADVLTGSTTGRIAQLGNATFKCGIGRRGDEDDRG